MDEDDSKSYQSLTDVSHWLLITVVSKKGKKGGENDCLNTALDINAKIFIFSCMSTDRHSSGLSCMRTHCNQDLARI